MSGDEYTPTTDEVRARYNADEFGYNAAPDDPCPEFDRWLAAHDATRICEAQAEALEDVAHDFENLASDCPVWSANAATWLRARAASIRTNERTTDDSQ